MSLPSNLKDPSANPSGMHFKSYILGSHEEKKKELFRKSFIVPFLLPCE